MKALKLKSSMLRGKASKKCKKHPGETTTDKERILMHGEFILVAVNRCQHEGCGFVSANAWDILDKLNEAKR